MIEVNDYLDNKYPIHWNGERMRVELGHYNSNNAISIRLISWDENMATEVPFATATVNVEHADLAEDEVIIKNYSENEGILPILIKEGIIAKPHDKVSMGYVTGHICQLIDY